MYTIVNNDAVLKLNGTAGQSTMIASNMENVKLAGFASLKSESYASQAIMEAEQIYDGFDKIDNINQIS